MTVSPSATLRQRVERATSGPWGYYMGALRKKDKSALRLGRFDSWTETEAIESVDAEANGSLAALAPALAVGLADAIDALEAAEKEASIAHDAIWSKDVASASILHENERDDSAQAAIWRLHEAIRPLLARLGDLVGQEEGT